MTDKKKPSSISGEHTLDLTMSGLSNDELIEKGRQKWEPSSSTPTSVRPKTTYSITSHKEEVSRASDSLVNASDSIVEGVLLVIGALEEQNKYQKNANEGLDKIIRDLTTIHVEMIKTRNDNHSVKRIMVTVLIGMVFTICISVYAIKSNFDQVKLDNARNDELQAELEKAVGVANEVKNVTISAAKLSQTKSEVVVLPGIKDGSAILEISQPVKQKTAGDVIITERDVVRVPINLKDAEVRAPVTTIMDDSLRIPKVIVHEKEN